MIEENSQEQYLQEQNSQEQNSQEQYSQEQNSQEQNSQEQYSQIIDPSKENLHKIYITLANKVIHTIEAPRKAVDVYKYRKDDINGIFYDPIDISDEWTEEKIQILDIKDGVPGNINIYRDDVYYRLTDNNNENCNKLRERGNTKASFFNKDLVTKCNNDILNLIKKDNDLLNKWIEKLSEGENKIQEERENIKKEQEILKEKEDKYTKLLAKENEQRTNYNNTKHMLDKIDQEEINFLIYYNNLRNSLEDSIIKVDIEKEGWNKKNIMEKFQNERDKYIKYEVDADNYKIEANTLFKTIIKEKELIQKKIEEINNIDIKLQEKGINLANLKDEIQFQINKYDRVLFNKEGGKKKDGKKKGGKKKMVKKVVKKSKK